MTTIEDDFNQLQPAADRLNAASNLLTNTIADLDDRLKSLNIGLDVWIDWPNCPTRRIGYAKVKQGGLAIAQQDPDGEWWEWAFNSAPRLLRIEALDHLPLLLTALRLRTYEVTYAITRGVRALRTDI